MSDSRTPTPASGAGSGNAIGGRSPAPRLHVALLWHQHQPLYRDTGSREPRGSLRQPWVRLHAIRDYYSMPAIAAAHPGIRVTINLTPVLLRQIEDYAERGATDRALELTLTPAEELSEEERQEVLSTFFDAQWHNQIFPHARYAELFGRRQTGQAFSTQELRDLQVWFNLAWFGVEFRSGEVELVTGERASARRFVQRGRDFGVEDVEAVVEEQRKILRAVVPLHRTLQDAGRIEVSTTPACHPILPLLVDTDGATVDRPGARLPRRFAWPEDAEEQVRRAVEAYRGWFGRPPRGMWPAEGAVSRGVIPILARHGVRWIATDRKVLAGSGRWGYEVDDPDVLCRPYRAEEGEAALSVFFRDTVASDLIGFQYQSWEDPEGAARHFLRHVKERFAAPPGSTGDRVLTVALDGENAWGAYRDDGRPFLHALYRALAGDPEILTVTFGEYLEGNPARAVAAHPPGGQRVVHDLRTGSWIDERGSAPGADLGTWIGEEEENRAWELLGEAREFLAARGAGPATHPDAFEALYAAEASDWFWWLGEDQESGRDPEFDELFRLHLRNVYRALGAEPPDALWRYIVPRTVEWTFAAPVARIQPGDRLAVRTNCPGILLWRVDGGEPRSERVPAVGGVMAGQQRHRIVLGPFTAGDRQVRFRFECTHPRCPGEDLCSTAGEHEVAIG